MKTSTILWIVGDGVAAYVAYNWYMNQQAAAATPALPAPAPSTDTSGTGSSDPNAPPQGPIQDPYYGSGGNVMFMQPPSPAPVAVPYGQPGHPLAFGMWFSQLSPAQRAELAKQSYAARLARYHEYCAWYERTHRAA